MKKSLYALLAVTALASPAFAQNAPATNSTSTTTTMTSSSDQFIAKAQPGEWRASKYSGVSIYGPNHESIGKVSDVILDKSGQAKVVVISVGGVMGVGSKTVGLPFSAVTWSDKPMEPSTTSTISGSKAPTAPTAPPAGGTSTSASNSGSSMSASASPSVLDYPDYGTVNMTADQLKAAPDFKYASEKAS